MANEKTDASGWWVRWIPLFLNAGALIWTAATLSSDLRYLTVAVNEIKAERYTIKDASRESQFREFKEMELQRRIELLEVRQPK